MPKTQKKVHKASKTQKKKALRTKAPIKRKLAAKPAARKKVAARKKIPSVKIKSAPLPVALEDVVSQASSTQLDEISIEATKFNIGVAHNAQAMVSHDIPWEYGKDGVTLLIVDPRFVFTYWEVGAETMKSVAQRCGGTGKLTLRFYDITSASNPDEAPCWDVEVFDRLGNWYLKLDFPEQRLCLDIGMKGPSGEFVRISRSNIMRLPAQSLARPGPIKWMVVTPAGDRLISDTEEYTDADLALLKKILGPYFFDLLMRGRFASIAGSSLEAIFYDVQALRAGESPTGRPAWLNT